MSNDAVDDEESVGSLMLITPLQHSVVRHDLIKSFVSNTAFILKKGLCFVCSPVLEEFSSLRFTDIKHTLLTRIIMHIRSCGSTANLKEVCAKRCHSQMT